MSRPFVPAFRRHVRFYISLALGIAAAILAFLLGQSAPLLVGGDVFYLVFLSFSWAMIRGQSTEDIAKRAKEEDEGTGVVMVIIVATMLYFSTAVFEALGQKHGPLGPLLLAGFGAPLGWFVLHTAMAFHYADIYYFDDPETKADQKNDLEFPGGGDPGPLDFLYFSFVIGMTCQVSDVQIKTSVMRRTVTWHGVVSFFFNTVFIAMAVNAAVAMVR